MNTSIEYLYRDANNYKQYEEAILEGELTDEQKALILKHEDEFIPSQVGLSDLQPRFLSFPSSDDHVWHEMGRINGTHHEPNMPMTAAEFAEKFRGISWDIEGAMKRLGLDV